MSGGPSITPYFSYRDAKGAMAFVERARAAGAEIVYGPDGAEFGTRRYRAHDIEGHEWSFGTYQPKASAPDWA